MGLRGDKLGGARQASGWVNREWSEVDWRAWGIATHTHYAEVESTQTASHALGADLTDADLPLLVTCDSQTAGRGRGQRSWLQQVGGLAFTVVLPLQVDALRGQAAGDWPRWWALWTGLCLQATAAELVPGGNSRLKWPNDLWIDGRKNAGILLETLRGRPQHLAVGVGVNVNNRILDVPAGQSAPPISWIELGGDAFDLPHVLGHFLQRWLPVPRRQLPDLAECCGRFERVDALSGERLTVVSSTAFVARKDDPRILEPLTRSADSEMVSGAAPLYTGLYDGIGRDGCLRLRQADGRVLVFPSAEQVRICQ